jgi:polysaccharide deacetylase family protein (PEP-CTERM system associated)
MPGTLKYAPPVISIDVEDWPQSSWDRDLPITQRAADNTRRLLELLDRVGVRTTMFVLGKLAQRFPELVREIHVAGHEVASHGYGHVEIFKQTRGEFAADLKRGKDLLEQIIGQRVRGYRAPDFSIVRGSLWALQELAEQGFEYDSSIFPVKRRRYGIPDWPLAPMRVQLSGGNSIVEFPIASYRAWGKNWPVGGGGYHRLLPGLACRWFARRVMQSRPFVFYCHPYEFDPREFAEIAVRIPLKLRLHQGLGRGRFESRFVSLVHRFGGCRMVDLLDAHSWPDFQLDAPLSAAQPMQASDKQVAETRNP